MLRLLDMGERERVERTVRSAMECGHGFRVCFPAQRETGGLKWLQMDGWDSGDGYYILFSGVSPEAQLFQRITDENDEDVYVIDQGNYDLLYANRIGRAYCKEEGESGQKCYQFLRGRESPCPNCFLKPCGEGGTVPEVYYQENGHFYITRF